MSKYVTSLGTRIEMMIIVYHRLYMLYTLYYCFYYYALLWHVLYILVNIDQDEMKLLLVNIT